MTQSVSTPHGVFHAWKRKAPVTGVSLYRATRPFRARETLIEPGQVFPAFHYTPLGELLIHQSSIAGGRYLGTWDVEGREWEPIERPTHAAYRMRTDIQNEPVREGAD